MGLDDIIAREAPPATVPRLALQNASNFPVPPEQSPTATGCEGREDRVRHHLAQMGHTLQTHHVRQPRRCGDESPRKTRRDGGGMSPAEKIQRWLAWVLKKGNSELEVTVSPLGGENCSSGSWASLGQLAEAMRKAKPEFGEFDARSLEIVLTSTDQAGRFEISAGGYLRLVPRDERREKPPRCPLSCERYSDRGRSRSSSSSCTLSRPSSPAAPTPASPHLSLPRGGGECFSIATPRGGQEACGHVDTMDVEEAADTDLRTGLLDVQSRRAPSPPPWGGDSTDVWTHFADEEAGKVWWYYEGPLGKWWCKQQGEAPVPYTFQEVF